MIVLLHFAAAASSATTGVAVMIATVETTGSTTPVTTCSMVAVTTCSMIAVSSVNS